MARVEKQEHLIREMAFILFAQKDAILRTGMVVFVIVLAIAFFWPPSYSAEGSFLVKGKKTERNPESLESTILRVTPITKEDLNSEAQIFTSEAVIKNTILTLRESRNLFIPKPEGPTLGQRLGTWLKHLGLGGETEVLDPEMTEQDPILAAQIRRIKGAVSIKVVPSSRVISINLRWNNPERARLILSTLMDSYLEHRRELFAPEQVKGFFSRQVVNYSEGLERKKSDLLKLIQAEKAPDPAMEIENNLLLKKGFQEDLNILEKTMIETGEASAHLLEVLDKDEIQIFSFVDNEAIREMGAKVRELVLERSRLHRIFHPNSVQFKGIEEELEEAYTALKEEVNRLRAKKESTLRTLRAQVTLLRQKIDEIDKRNMVLKQLQVDLETINRESELLSFSFQTFYKRREEANISMPGEKGGLNSQVVILTRARASTSPVFPNKRILIPFGFIVSLLVGFSIGFMNEFFDHTFKRPEDSARFAGLKLIFSIPDHSPQETSADDRKRRPAITVTGKRKGATMAGFAYLALVPLALFSPHPGGFTPTDPDRFDSSTREERDTGIHSLIMRNYPVTAVPSVGKEPGEGSLNGSGRYERLVERVARETVDATAEALLAAIPDDEIDIINNDPTVGEPWEIYRLMLKQIPIDTISQYPASGMIDP